MNDHAGIPMPSRRSFLGGAAVTVAGLATELPQANADPYGGQSRLATAPALPPELKITGVLMDDFEAGDPVNAPLYPTSCACFLTARGQAGIVFPAPAAKDGYLPNKVVCLLRNDASVSGWTRSEYTLPGNDTLVDQPGGFPTLTVRSGADPRLYIYATSGIHVCQIDPVLAEVDFIGWNTNLRGEFIQMAPCATTHPENAQFLVEHTLDLKLFYLRDLSTHRASMVSNNGNPLFFNNAASRYRATILSTPQGYVLRFLVALDARISLFAISSAGYGDFFQAGESVIVQAAHGQLLHNAIALESADGSIELFYSADTTPQAVADVRTVVYSQRALDKNAAPKWSAAAPIALSFAGLPEHVPCELVAMGTDATLGITNLLFHTGGGQRANPDRIWLCQRNPAGQLTTPAPVASGNVQLVEPASSFQFVRTEPVAKGDFRERLRDLCWYTQEGGFAFSPILQPSDKRPTPVPWLRIGFSLLVNGGAAPATPIRVRSAAPVFATLNGKLFFLTPDHAVTTTTDLTGRLSIGIDVGTSLQGPDLYLTSDALAKGYEVLCHPADLVNSGLSHLTADKLRNARDTETGKPILANPNDAPAVMAIIQLVEAAIQSTRPPRPSVSGAPFKLTNDGSLGAEVVQAGSSSAVRALAAHASALAIQPWNLTRTNGVLTYQPAPASQITALKSGHTGGIQPMFGLDDVFGGIGGAIGGVLGGIGDFLSGTLGSIFGSGLDIFLNIVKEGAKIWLKMTLGPLSALPILGQILDFVGIGMGKLLRLITGLFVDWDSIERSRDNWRGLIRQNIIRGVRHFSNPAVSVRGMADQIRNAGQDIQSYCQQMKSNPREKMGASGFTLPPIFLQSSLLDSEPVRALLEKVLDAIPSIFSDPGGPNLQDFDSAVGKVGTDLVAVLNALIPSMGEFADLIWAEIGQGNILSAPLDPFLDIIGDHAAGSMSALATVVADVANLMEMLWQNPGVLIDWFDQPLRIPGVSAFYNSLTGGTLSIYDFFCLICGLFHDPGRQSAPAEMIRALNAQRALGAHASGEFIKDWATFTLASMQTMTSGLLAAQDCTHVKPTGFSTLEKLTMMADMMATLAVATKVIVDDFDDEMAFLMGMMLIMCVGPILLIRINGAEYRRGPVGVAPPILLLHALIWFFFKRGDLQQSKSAVAYEILVILETVEMIGVRYYVQNKSGKPITNPALLALILGAKMGMSETRAILAST